VRTQCACASRATYPERLSTNAAPTPMGGRQYSRERGGITGRFNSTVGAGAIKQGSLNMVESNPITARLTVEGRSAAWFLDFTVVFLFGCVREGCRPELALKGYLVAVEIE
jgi:hypothetical protein